MRFLKFHIENFKGIEAATLDFDAPRATKIMTLIGLNESGKTTILEAINSFSPDREGIERLYKDVIKEVQPEGLVPKSKKGNFTGDILVKASLEMSTDDLRSVSSFCVKNGWNLDPTCLPKTIEIERRHEFKDSNLIESDTYWPVDVRLKKGRQTRYYDYNHETTEWQAVVDFIGAMIPKISYFPTFVFNFPERIYLTNAPDNLEVNAFYSQIIQEILDCLPGSRMTLKTHVVDRVENAFEPGALWDPFKFFRSDKREQIDHVMLQISNLLTDVIFSRWNDIFGVKIKDKVIDVRWHVEAAQADATKQAIYLTFSIRDGKSQYEIAERSLGFRWFFCFLLFTQFRGAKQDGGAVFLFDEPASNLHSRAQEQLLKSFHTIAARDNIIIYSTHSHYMIDPRWLEGAFIVFNDAIDYNENPAEEPGRRILDTSIHISRYRDFVGQNPDKLTYFQPILDTLQYGPSKLELGREAVFVEGKNDYYMLTYFAFALGFQSNVRFIPGTGASGLAPLISLYLGWGQQFVVLLDDDRAGREARDKYQDEYLLSTSQVGTLSDFVQGLKDCRLEGILTKGGRSIIEDKLGRRPTKKDIGRFFQEKFATREIILFDSETLATVTMLLAACARQFDTKQRSPS